MLNKLFNIEPLSQVGRFLVGGSEQSRMSVGQQAPIRVSVPKGKPFIDDTNKIPPENIVETAAPIVRVRQETMQENSGISLQDAIIWSEILGKPMCKRRKDRNRFL